MWAPESLNKIYFPRLGMIGRRKSEGHPIKEKPEDKAWQQWFQGLSMEEHDRKLRELGLDEEDVGEFNEKFVGSKKPDKKAVPPVP